MSIWAEIWTRPGDAAYGRVLDDLPAPLQGLHDGVNLFGDGNMVLPDTFDGLDSILFIDHLAPANSVSSTVKLFDDSDPTDPIFEWIPNSILPAESKEDHLVDVAGDGIKSIVSYGRVDAYDWDGSDDFASLDPDWQFGVGVSLLQNGDFETQPMPNGGFEEGSINYWQATDQQEIFDDAVLLATNDPANADSGDWYGQITAIDGPDGGARRTISGLVIGETYTITGKMNEPAATGDRFRAGVSDAITATHTNAYEADGYWWAEVGNVVQPNGASDGTWQTFTLTFEAGATTTELVIVYADAGAGPPFRIDSWTITGPNVGVYPWEHATNTGIINTFEHQSVIVHSGTGALEVQGDDLVWTNPYNGSQSFLGIGAGQEADVEVGKTYTAEVWVYQASGSNQVFQLIMKRRSLAGPLGTSGSSWLAWQTATIPTATWTKIILTFVSDVTGIDFEIRWKYQGAIDTSAHPSPTFYIDDAALFPGLPSTTIGEILRLLYDQMTDTTLYSTIFWNNEAVPGTPYLTLDFSDSLDSGGTAWFESEVSMRVWMRMTLKNVLDSLVTDYGIEWRVVPNNVELGTYLLQVYNPGTMKVDYTAAIGPAIQGGSSDVRRQVVRLLPKGTDMMVEGLGRLTGRDRDANLIGALGSIASSRLDKELPELTSVGLAAFEDRLNTLTDGLTLAYSLVNPQDIPLVAYGLGDLLAVHDPPEVDFDARLVDVTASLTPNSETWDVQFVPATAQGS